LAIPYSCDHGRTTTDHYKHDGDRAAKADKAVIAPNGKHKGANWDRSLARSTFLWGEEGMVAKKTDLELAELGKDVCQRQRIIECARIEQGLGLPEN
jgi:hypothetical protein